MYSTVFISLVGMHTWATYEVVVDALMWYKSVLIDGASLDSPIALARFLYFLSGLIYEASLPPFGPIMKPRYSALSVIAKSAHLAACFLMYFRICSLSSSVMGTPRGMSAHFLVLRHNPEILAKRSKPWWSLFMSLRAGITESISSAKAQVTVFSIIESRRRRNGTNEDCARGWAALDNARQNSIQETV